MSNDLGDTITQHCNTCGAMRVWEPLPDTQSDDDSWPPPVGATLRWKGALKDTTVAHVRARVDVLIVYRIWSRQRQTWRYFVEGPEWWEHYFRPRNRALSEGEA